MNIKNPKILLLEDFKSDIEFIKRALNKAEMKFEMVVADTKAAFINALSEFSPDIILADHSMPSFSSSEALEIIYQSGKKIPIIIVTGTITEEQALNILKSGASDYILKDRIQRLPAAIINALEKHILEEERQEYLEEIITNEALLKDAEKLAHIGSWQANIVTGKIKWSDEAYRIFGLEPSSITPSFESFIRFVHPDDQKNVEEAITQATQNQDLTKLDYRIIDVNNKIKNIHSEIYIERDNTGNPVLIKGFNRDYTENKTAEELLHKTEQNYKRVVENIIDALMIDDLDGNVIFANDQFLNLFGIENKNIEGLVLEDYVAPEFRKELRDRHNRRMQGEDVLNIFEYEGIKGDGTRMWLEVRVSKIIENNKIIGTQSAIRDITKNKMAQEELLKSQANLNAIFNNTDIAFILTDNNLNIISYNLVAELGFINIMQKPLNEGNNLMNYIVDDRKEWVTENYAKVFEGEHITYESCYPHPNGALIWYDIQLSPVKGTDGNILGMLMSMTYITDWKIVQLEREKLTNDLISRNKDLEQFAYIVSHNLRGPVANILGSANILSTIDLSDDEKNFIFSGLISSINKLDNVIIDLNEILRLKHSIMESKEKLFFSNILADVISSIDNFIKNENVHFETDFSEAEEIFTVKSYLHSIFYNLISNSIKYRKPNIPPHIHVKSYKLNDITRLCFQDNGIGLNLNKVGNQIFGLYKKFHPSSEGKGMGLFMVKTQLEAMGGTIKVESEENTGTKFIIDFK